jgi:hypothetical protein
VKPATILKPISERKANREFDFEAHTASNIERLFTQLFEIDLMIERCASLLNKSQPLKSGKIAVVFGVRRKINDHVSITEPFYVRLFAAEGSVKKWTMRRIEPADLRKRGKLEAFLPAHKKVKNAKGVWTYAAENYRETVLLCREMTKLMEVRDSIKAVISFINQRTSNIQKTIDSLLPKAKSRMDSLEQSIEYDFSNPEEAYSKIRQKILARQ